MIMLRQGRLFVLLPEQHRVGLGGVFSRYGPNFQELESLKSFCPGLRPLA